MSHQSLLDAPHGPARNVPSRNPTWLVGIAVAFLLSIVLGAMMWPYLFLPRYVSATAIEVKYPDQLRRGFALSKDGLFDLPEIRFASIWTEDPSCREAGGAGCGTHTWFRRSPAKWGSITLWRQEDGDFVVYSVGTYSRGFELALSLDSLRP